MESKGYINTKGSEPESIPMGMALVPAGVCFFEAAIWSILFRRALSLDYDGAGILFFFAAIWLTLGIVICAMLASELAKRGVFYRMVFSSDSMALAGELNLFLGIVVFAIRLNQGLYGAGFYIELLLTSVFIAIGSMVFGLTCVKSKSFTGTQTKMALTMAMLNGMFAILFASFLSFILFPPQL